MCFTVQNSLIIACLLAFDFMLHWWYNGHHANFFNSSVLNLAAARFTPPSLFLSSQSFSNEVVSSDSRTSSFGTTNSRTGRLLNLGIMYLPCQVVSICRHK